MNKNRLKALFLGFALSLSFFAVAFAPATSAITPPPGPSKSQPVIIPVNFSRVAPTMGTTSNGCWRPPGTIGPTPGPCDVVSSGTGIYHYVTAKTAAATMATIPTVTVTDSVTADSYDTNNFVVNNGSIYVYGLTSGHSYSITFTFDDARSSDIVSQVNKVSDLCDTNAPVVSNVDQTTFNIARRLSNGCSVYNKQPFLPAPVTGIQASSNPINYTGQQQTLTAVNVKSTAANTTSGTDANDVDPCTKLMTSSAMGWLMCPLIKMGTSITDKVDGILKDNLTIDTTIFAPDSGYHQAWAAFRNIALALLLIAGLVMVIGQSLGMEILDAYTVRKLAPRIFVVAIGIALSWTILGFLVGFFNDIGNWAGSLIQAPFPAAKNINTAGIVGDILGWTTASAGTVIGVSLVALKLGIGGVASLFFVAVLAVIIGLATLILRTMVVTLTIILAPLAIAAYILPGTQKLWAFWKDTFLTTMFMFPIIMGFLAIGKVMASVSENNGIIRVMVYFLPYLLLPFAFKLAGGLMSTVFSIANDKSKGVFDRQRKKRQLIREHRAKAAASNSLWDPSSRTNRLLHGNTLASWATAPAGNLAYAGRDTIFRRQGSKVAGQIEHAKAEQSGKLFEEMNKNGFNDKGYRALSGMHDGMTLETQKELKEAGLFGKTPASIKDLQTMGRILSDSDNDTERIGGQAILGNAGRLATLYQDEDMMKADIGAAGIMGLAAHGFADGDDLAAAGNKLMGGHIKTDAEGKQVRDTRGKLVYEGMNEENAGYAQSIISQAQMVGMRSRPDVKPGYGVLYDSKNSRFIDGMTEGGRDLDLIQTLGSHDVAGAKGGFVKKMKESYREILQPTQQQQQYAANFASMNDNEKEMLKAENPDAYKQYARADKAAKMRQATKDQLFQWTSSYSNASTDVKTQALEMIQDFGMQDEYNQAMRTGRSPEEIAAMEQAGVNPDAAAGTQPGGGGGGGGH